MSSQIFEHAVAQHLQVFDQQLLSRARSGDQVALGEFCLRYPGMLKQRIIRIIRNREDAEDVLQETLPNVADQTIHKLRSIMPRLPTRLRTVMELYCVKELRLKDAAAILGITEVTTKSRVLQGQNRLRRSLRTRRLAELRNS